MRQWIKWSRSDEFVTERGEMPIENINDCLTDFRNAAQEYQKRTNADHVIYAAEEYDDNGNLSMIRFYQNFGMDDKTFEDRTSLYKGKVYAIHKR